MEGDRVAVLGRGVRGEGLERERLRRSRGGDWDGWMMGWVRVGEVEDSGTSGGVGLGHFGQMFDCVMAILRRGRDGMGIFSSWWSGIGGSFWKRIVLKGVGGSNVCCFVHEDWEMAEILEHVSCNVRI